MCNSGTCPHEIKHGENRGDCGKPPTAVCPEMLEEYPEDWDEVSAEETDENR